MIDKFVYIREVGIGILDSRSNLWDDRLREFTNYPIFGVGFAEIDIIHDNNYTKDGVIELGSSWLGLLSMLGIVGYFIHVLFLCMDR